MAGNARRWLTMEKEETGQGEDDRTIRDYLTSIGSIRLEVFFVKNVRYSTDQSYAQKKLRELGTVSEKALKGQDALSHQARFVGQSSKADLLSN
jgi:hypothetical protein